MLKEIKRQLYITRNSLFIGLAICAGVSIFVSIVANIAVRYDESMTAMPPLASIIFAAIGLFYSLLLSVINTPILGDMCIKFGALRRRLFPAMFLVNVAFAAVLVLIGKLWIFVDHIVANFSGVPVGAFALPLGWLLLGALAAGLMGMWIGALLMRYGKKAFWVVFAVYMGIVLFGSRISTALAGQHEGPLTDIVQGIAGAVARVPIPGLAVLGLLLAGAMAAHAWAMMRRMPAN